MNIIGISGKSRSGKTTMADYISCKLKAEIWGFGDEVKQEFYLKYPHFAGELWRQDVKDQTLENGLTARQVLVDLGISRRRKDPDHWVKAWQGTIWRCFAGDLIIAPDVRFPNEVKAVEQEGGIVIRLTRNPDNVQVETETALDDYRFQHYVYNHLMTIDQANEVGLAIAKKYLHKKGISQ